MAVHPCTMMLKQALYSIGKDREERERERERERTYMNIYEPRDDLVSSDVVSTLSLVPYKLATKSNSTACRGRQCRQSWTCSTRSSSSNSTKSTVSNSTVSPVCTWSNVVGLSFCLLLWDVMLVWRKGNIEKTVSSCSIVYYYNGVQRYEQFLQVCQLYRALILLSLALFRAPLCLRSSWCYICI